MSGRARTGASAASTPALLRGLTAGAALARRSSCAGRAIGGPAAVGLGSLAQRLRRRRHRRRHHNGGERRRRLGRLVGEAEAGRHARLRELALYIDTDHGKHPSLEQFTKQTGIKVNYKEVIQDNAPFYAKIAPVAEGRPVDRLRHHRDDERLAADRADQPGLADPARPGAAPELLEVREPDRHQPRLRQRQQVHRRLAVGLHRHRLQPEADRPRDHLDRRPLGPEVQGPRRHDERQHRARQRRPAEARDRARRPRPRPTGRRPRRC